jgi:GMP synthase (glutamine-hydrolysing)
MFGPIMFGLAASQSVISSWWSGVRHWGSESSDESFMPRILIFNGAPDAAQKRIANEGGRSNEAMITNSLKRFEHANRPIDLFTLNVADGENLPQGMALTDFDGVWISGSPLNAYHMHEPAVRRQVELARDIWDLGIPSFGSCWGLQVMTAALGGKVHLNPRGREIGIARTIIVSDIGRKHAMFRDKPIAFDALCTHEDEVETLPTCGAVLASNSVSRVQAAVFNEGSRSFWGVQYHPEMEFAQIAAIMAMRAERHIREGLARTREDVQRQVEDFRQLSVDVSRKDLAWAYGVGQDILDPVVRTLEFRNWLDAKVIHRAA